MMVSMIAFKHIEFKFPLDWVRKIPWDDSKLKTGGGGATIPPLVSLRVYKNNKGNI